MFELSGILGIGRKPSLEVLGVVCVQLPLNDRFGVRIVLHRLPLQVVDRRVRIAFALLELRGHEAVDRQHRDQHRGGEERRLLAADRRPIGDRLERKQRKGDDAQQAPRGQDEEDGEDKEVPTVEDIAVQQYRGEDERDQRRERPPAEEVEPRELAAGAALRGAVERSTEEIAPGNRLPLAARADERVFQVSPCRMAVRR